MNDRTKATEYTILSHRSDRLICEFILRDQFLKKTVGNANYHFHSAYEVHICVEGRMQITVEDRCLTLFPRDLCMIAPGRVHYVQLDQNSVSMGFRFCFLPCGKEICEEYALLDEAFGGMEDSFVLKNSSLLEKYVSHASENMQNAGSPLITASLLFLAVYELASSMMARGGRDVVETERSMDVALSEEIETYINSHYDKRILLSEIAAHVNLGTRQTERIIKKLFGMTFGELVCQKRLAAAKLLLRTTKRSLDEIATACGFEEKSYFCRRFSALYGISLGKYRTECRKEVE